MGRRVGWGSDFVSLLLSPQLGMTSETQGKGDTNSDDGFPSAITMKGFSEKLKILFLFLNS